MKALVGTFDKDSPEGTVTLREGSLFVDSSSLHWQLQHGSSVPVCRAVQILNQFWIGNSMLGCKNSAFCNPQLRTQNSQFAVQSWLGLAAACFRNN